MMHWLRFNDGREVTGCHCGFSAHPSDDGYGDSVVAHIQIEAKARTFENLALEFAAGSRERAGYLRRVKTFREAGNK